MSNKRICICCGKEYEYCPNCSKGNKPAWMLSFDKEMCKELFNIVSLYNMHRINKEDVRRFVTSNGILASSYTEPIRKVLQEVEPLSTREAPVVNIQNKSEETSEHIFRRHRDKKKRRYWI